MARNKPETPEIVDGPPLDSKVQSLAVIRTKDAARDIPVDDERPGFVFQSPIDGREVHVTRSEHRRMSMRVAEKAALYAIKRQIAARDE